MIGSDHPLFHMVLREVPGMNLTNLGWVCFGLTLVEEFTLAFFLYIYCSKVVKQCQTPDDALGKFWELDAIGIKDNANQALTAEEKVAL